MGPRGSTRTSARARKSHYVKKKKKKGRRAPCKSCSSNRIRTTRGVSVAHLRLAHARKLPYIYSVLFLNPMRGHKVRNSTVVFLRSRRFFFFPPAAYQKAKARANFFSARWRPFGGRLNFDGRLRFDGAAGVGAEAGFGFGALRAPRAGNVRSKRSRERAEGTRKCAEGGWARALLLLAARGRPGGGAGGATLRARCARRETRARTARAAAFALAAAAAAARTRTPARRPHAPVHPPVCRSHGGGRARPSAGDDVRGDQRRHR